MGQGFESSRNRQIMEIEMKNNILYKYGPGALGILNLAVANGNLMMIITGIILIVMSLMDFLNYDG